MRNVADLSRRLWSRHRIPLLVRVVDSGASNSISATTASSSSPSTSTVIDALRAIIAEHQVRTLYWNDEYEVDERKRDARVRTSVEKGEMAPCNGVQSFEDQCVVRPGLLRSKAAGNPYTYDCGCVYYVCCTFLSSSGALHRSPFQRLYAVQEVMVRIRLHASDRVSHRVRRAHH